MNTYTFKRTFIGQLPFGSDLYDSLTEIARQEEIHVGRITAIGATTYAVVAYFNQDTKKYDTIDYSEGMEILNLSGNITLRDGKPFVHAHIVLGDSRGNAFGGHLLSGTKVLACEITIEEYDGEPLVREFNESTGLALWKTGNLL